MTKYTNPFYTINEAVAVLKSVGAKPEANPFKYDESYVHWPDHIIGMHACRVYDESGDHHFELEIHVDLAGLNKLVEMTGLTISREHHSDTYDTLAVRPGTLLKIFTLEAKEVTCS